MANRYWVGGTAAWDATAGTKWALTSGAAGGQAVPTNADAVFLDAASGAVTVTVTGNMPCLSFNCTGFTGTLDGASSPTIAIAGTICFISAGMTIGATIPGLFFNSTGTTTTTLTSSGKTLGLITVGTLNHTVSLSGSLTCSAITVTAGTFTAGSNTVTTGGVNSSGSSNRAFNGSGTWNIGGTSSGTLWASSISTGMIVSGLASATLNFNPSHAVAYSIAFGTVTLAAAVNILPSAFYSTRIALSGGTFSNFTVTGPNRLYVSGSLTLTGALNGKPDGIITVESQTVSVMNWTVATAFTGKYVAVMGLTKVGAGTIVFNPGWDLSANTGVTIIPGVRKASSRVGV